MLLFIKLLILLASLIGIWTSVLTPAGRGYVKDVLLNVWQGSIDIAQPLLAAVESQLGPIVSAFVTAFKTHGPAIADAVKEPVAAVARDAFNLAAANLVLAGESTPENAVQVAADAFAAAFGFGISSHVVTAAFEAALPEKLNTLNGIGPLLAQMAGFAEIGAAVRDPLYSAAFGRSLEYHFRSIFKPELPDEGDAVTWHSRRKLTDDQLRKIFSFSGLKSEYETPYIESAYRALQPRLFATLFQDVEFPTQAVHDAMEFAGIRDQEIELMLPALEKSSLKNVRQQYLASVMRASELGTLGDSELAGALQDLEYSDQAAHWIRLTIATRKLEQLAELYRKSISEAYHFGTISDADYVPSLNAIGIADADARAHYAIDSIKKHGQEAQAVARAVAAAEQRIEREAMSAAMAEYAAGQLDAVQLAAALADVGVPLAVIPFAVSLAQARSTARKRSVFGLFVTPAQAVTLRERVAVIQENRVKDFIDNQTALDELRALDVPETNAESLVARWQAQSEPRAKPA